MSKFKFLKRFHGDEDGAVSVDWVVLTAALVGLAAGTITTIQGATQTLTGKIETKVSDTKVGTGD